MDHLVKCKNCGQRHRLGQCVGTDSIQPGKVLQEVLHSALRKSVKVVAKGRPSPVKRAPKKPPFDRAAYQKEYIRNYMRKRRAAIKDKPK